MADGADQRKFARIEASIACSVATSVDAFEAAVANVSKGGAAILGPHGAAKVGETITLMLERDEGLVTLSLPGEVVRVEPRGDHTLYGVEFEPLPPDEEAQLDLLLQMVAGGQGQGRRKHPRVAARVEVTCRNEEIFRGMLHDLSKGGLAVKTLRDVPVGKTMTVAFGMRGLPSLIEISGEVMNSEKLEHGFRVGVQFTPVSEGDRAQVARLLDVLLGIKAPQREPGDEDGGE